MSQLLRSAGGRLRRGRTPAAALGERDHTIFRALGVILGVVGVPALLALLLQTRRVSVVGPSMIPTLDDGDRLLVRRTRRLRLGDLAVFADPEQADRLLVKRVAGLSDAAVVLVGDNEGASRDSRAFGAVPVAEILGIATYRYGPPPRAGVLRRPAGDVAAIDLVRRRHHRV